MQSHILIVDDDHRILKLLKKFFEQNNFLVSTATSVFDAEQLLQSFTFDLLILDIMLPGVTGIEFTQTLRSIGNKIPIIMLTALTEPDDRARGIESGANDYLTKPFESKELLLRVQNLIESYNQHKNSWNVIYFGNNQYDPETKMLTKNNERIFMTPTEEKLLDILIKNAGKVISRDELSDIIGLMQIRSVDAHITNIRKKIEDSRQCQQYIRTVRGVGYVFNS